MANATPEMPRHVEVAYKDAVDNITFNQKQQWVTTNYALLVYAAIFVVRAGLKNLNKTISGVSA